MLHNVFRAGHRCEHVIGPHQHGPRYARQLGQGLGFVFLLQIIQEADDRRQRGVVDKFDV